MSGDKFYLKTRMLLNAEGETSEMAVEIAKDGEDVAAKMEIEGMVINMVMKDGKMYMVMHELETVMVMDMPAEQAQEQMMVPDTSDLEFVEAGTGKLFGRTLPYEAYRVKDGDGEETRFYFDGTKFVGMQSFIDGVEAVSMEILELSTNIPASLFDIPSNYQVTDMFGG